MNFFTPTKKAVGYSTTADGRIDDTPKTPWERLQASGVFDEQQLAAVTALIDGINHGRTDPADQHHPDATPRPGQDQGQDQDQDQDQSQDRGLAAARHIDLQALQPSINRFAETR